MTHWGNFADGKANVGETANSNDWRIARTIIVADDNTVAQSYGRADPKCPFRFYYSQIFAKLKKAGRHAVFKHDRDEPDDALTLDRIVDDLMICGTVEDVVDQILAFREITGDFGTMVMAGMDWVDEGLTRRSMQLLAEEVLPRVDAAIGTASAKAAE